MVLEGLGQLEAYINAEEGVAFQMDNGLIWNSLGSDDNFPIYGLSAKTEESKFWVTCLPSGEVMLRLRTGAYLALRSGIVDPNTYSLCPVLDLHSQDASFIFEVFYRDNKVAFRAFNGLFLARVDRGINTIDAIKEVADDSCCFRPMIGDLHVPTFEILGLTAYDLSTIRCFPCELKSQKFVNNSNTQKSHTFSITWQITVMDRVAWKHAWGLGLASACKLEINGMSIKLKYTKNNEKVVQVRRGIGVRFRKEVVVPPRSTCTAYLIARKSDNASFTFTAAIRKVKSNGDMVTLYQPGAWAGFMYQDICLVTEIVVHESENLPTM